MQAGWGIGVLASVLWEFVIFSPFNLLLQALLQVSAANRVAIRKREREREEKEKLAKQARQNDRWKNSGEARSELAGPGKSEVGSSVTGDLLMEDVELSEAELEKSKKRLEAALRKDLPTLVDSFFRKHYPGDGDIPFDEFQEDLGDLGVRTLNPDLKVSSTPNPLNPKPKFHTPNLKP